MAILLFIEPELKNTARIQDSQTSLKQQLEVLVLNRQQVMKQLSEDPDQDVSARISAIDRQLDEFDAQFSQELRQLVSPGVMPIVLQQLLDEAKGLKLLTLDSVPPTKLFASGDKDDVSGQQSIFRHGIKLRLEGSYSATESFLEKAEKLEWQIYWQDFTYRVDEYPRATIELSVFTLSTSEAFISVY